MMGRDDALENSWRESDLEKKKVLRARARAKESIYEHDMQLHTQSPHAQNTLSEDHHSPMINNAINMKEQSKNHQWQNVNTIKKLALQKLPKDNQDHSARKIYCHNPSPLSTPGS